MDDPDIEAAKKLLEANGYVVIAERELTPFNNKTFNYHAACIAEMWSRARRMPR